MNRLRQKEEDLRKFSRSLNRKEEIQKQRDHNRLMQLYRFGQRKTNQILPKPSIGEKYTSAYARAKNDAARLKVVREAENKLHDRRISLANKYQLENILSHHKERLRANKLNANLKNKWKREWNAATKPRKDKRMTYNEWEFMRKYRPQNLTKAQWNYITKMDPNVANNNLPYDPSTYTYKGRRI